MRATILNEEDAERLLTDWRQWWSEAKGKPRRQWLEERRSRLRVYLGLREDRGFGRKFHDRRPGFYDTLHLIRMLNDTAAAQDLVACLRKTTATRGSETSPDYVICQILRALQQVGTRELTTDLVELARTTSAVQSPIQRSVLKSYESALNEITGKEIRAVIPATYMDKRGKKWKSATIRETAYAEWLN
jgi:hypothetical protein